MRLLPERFVRGATFRALLRSYLLLGLMLIALGVAVFTIRISRSMESQSRLTTQMLARIASETIFASNPDPRRLELLSGTIHEVGVPFIITDDEGRPRLWNADRVGVPLPDDFRSLLEVDPAAPSDPDLARVITLATEFDRGRDPIPVFAADGGPTVGLLHYGEGSLTRQLLVLPWLEALLIVAFMGIALVAFRNRKRSEQRRIWVGMAKETAHQLGTPLMSLQGWLALLAEGESSPAGRAEILQELGRDMERLNRVAERFSQIGSEPPPVPGDLAALLNAVVNYFQLRLPHLNQQVHLELKIDPRLPEVPMVRELLDWSLENLIKNALDAIDKPNGKVVVQARLKEEGEARWAEILVRDNGKGMSAQVRKEIFQPGFTTKERGWGMGLVLVHRIIVQAHGGHVRVEQSKIGEGTCFQLLLPLR